MVALMLALYIILTAIALALVSYAMMTKMPQKRLMLIILIYVFFIVISIPLNYAISSAIGVQNATAVMFVVYAILLEITFVIIYYKNFYK